MFRNMTKQTTAMIVAISGIEPLSEVKSASTKVTTATTAAVPPTVTSWNPRFSRWARVGRFPERGSSELTRAWLQNDEGPAEAGPSCRSFGSLGARARVAGVPGVLGLLVVVGTGKVVAVGG